MPRPVYTLRNLTHSYGRHRTLDIDALDIDAGGVTGLIGPNGSGKSTLLKVLALLRDRDGGEMLVDGVSTDGRERALRREITLLLQEPYLMRRSVLDNIAYGLKLRGCSRAEIAERAEDALLRVGMSAKDFCGRPWYRLSGGEVQRVALAVRLALRPRILLLDEPTANVDEASATRIKEAIWHAWNDWGTSILVATHDLVWLYEVATRIVSLYRGRIVSDGAENLIQGDWKRAGDVAQMSLRAQSLCAALPAQADAPLDCAALNPSRIALCREKPELTPRVNVLYGTLTQISLERATGEILLLVDCDGLFLRVRASRADVQNLSPMPGESLWLSFSIDALPFI